MNPIAHFEIKKFFRSRKNIIMFILFFLLLFLQFWYSNRVLGRFEEKDTGLIEENITLQQNEYEFSKQALELKNNNTAEKNYHENSVFFRKKLLDSYTNQLNAIKSGDPGMFWINQQKINELIIEYSTDLSEEDMISLLRENQRITAIKEGDFSFEKNLNIPVRAWPFVERILQLMSSISIFLLIIILVGDAMSKDFDDESIALYHSVIPKMKKITISKVLVVTISSFMSLLLIASLVFVVSGFISGFGSFHYPVIMGQLGTEFVLVSIAKAAFLFVIHYFFVVLFLVSLSVFLGTIFKQSLITIGILIISYYSFTVLTTMEFAKPFLSLIPFSQLDSYNVITGLQYLTPQISYWGSILILLMWALFFTGCSTLFIKKTM